MLLSVFSLALSFSALANQTCAEKKQYFESLPRVEIVDISQNDNFNFLNPALAAKTEKELSKKMREFERLNFSLYLYEVDFKNKVAACQEKSGRKSPIPYAVYNFESTDSTLVSDEFKACRTQQINTLAAVFSQPDRIVELTALGLDPSLQMIDDTGDYEKAEKRVKQSLKISRGVSVRKDRLIVSGYLKRDPEQPKKTICETIPASAISEKIQLATAKLIEQDKSGKLAALLEKEKAAYRSKVASRPAESPEPIASAPAAAN